MRKKRCILIFLIVFSLFNVAYSQISNNSNDLTIGWGIQDIEANSLTLRHNSAQGYCGIGAGEFVDLSCHYAGFTACRGKPGRQGQDGEAGAKYAVTRGQ